MINYYKTRLALLFAIFLAFSNTSIAYADVVSRESPYIEISNSITLDAKKIGDVFLIAEEVNLQNQVDGDFFAIGKKITVNAPVNGNARLIAEQIIINAPISGSLTYLSSNIYISSLGEIDKDAYGFTDRLILDGRIGRNLNLNTNENSLSKISGKVIGNIYYSGQKPEILNGSFINGKIIESFEIQNKESTARLDLIISKILHSLTMIFVGFIFIKFAGKKLPAIIESYKKPFVKNTLFGVASILVFPIGLIILIISLIGIPIAFFLIAFAIAVSYFGFIIPAIALGQKVFEKRPLGMLQLVSGVLLLDTITVTPYIGSTLSLIIVVSSIGLVTRTILANLKSIK